MSGYNHRSRTKGSARDLFQKKVLGKTYMGGGTYTKLSKKPYKGVRNPSKSARQKRDSKGRFSS